MLEPDRMDLGVEALTGKQDDSQTSKNIIILAPSFLLVILHTFLEEKGNKCGKRKAALLCLFWEITAVALEDLEQLLTF